jgi:hypothetical protein
VANTDNLYAPLADLKDLRQIPTATTTYDNQLLSRLQSASRAIDDRCGQRFYKDSSVSERVFDPAGRTVIRRNGVALLVDPIATGTGLLVHQGGTYYTISTDYVTEPRNASADTVAITSLLRLQAGWGDADVTVAAQWGWPSVPQAVYEATLLLANRRWFRKDSPEGVAGKGTDGPIQVSRFDPDIEDLLGNYMLYGFGS